ncbi:MAG: ribosomal RNA small subunit methyltransferase A [Deltaproteobacteria bacterium]|nr:ribosomal RNA small subunit methyltransferase A [Deltaproteobacteria bacterium]
MPEPPDPRELLKKHGLFAKKSFGQNFLRDYRVHARIAAALGVKTGDVVVELGAGLGTLTWYLAHTKATVHAVERDRDLAPILREVMRPFANVTIHEADAKKVDYASFGARVAVAGNIPYQLTSPIIFALFEQREVAERVALLVQKEVADRIVEPPGSKTYGLLSVLLGAIATVERVCVVPAGAFHPAPRVDSAVISWRVKPGVEGVDARFVAIVKAAFQQRRKTLRNALRAYGDPLLDALRAEGVEAERRAETVSPETFLAAARRYSRENSSGANS